MIMVEQCVRSLRDPSHEQNFFDTRKANHPTKVGSRTSDTSAITGGINGRIETEKFMLHLCLFQVLSHFSVAW